MGDCTRGLLNSIVLAPQSIKRQACCMCTEKALGQWTKSATVMRLLQPAGEAPLEEQLAGLEERRGEEEVWGQALFHVSEGLTAGRRWLWDEASRKISVLLASPAAFAGEHFLQVCTRCMHLSDTFERDLRWAVFDWLLQAQHPKGRYEIGTTKHPQNYKQLLPCFPTFSS